MSWREEDPRILRGMQAQLALRRARLESGERPLGWKIGFGSPEAMQRLGIHAPLVGFLMESSLLPPGSVVQVDHWTRPLAEPEIAVYIGKDLPGGTEREPIREAIQAIGPAIELVDLDRPPEDVEAILSGNIYHRYVLLGPRDESAAKRSVQHLRGRVFWDGAEVASVEDLEANTGPVVDAVSRVANLLASMGERLRGGDVIIAGSVIPPLPIERGRSEITFELVPVGRVSVRFQWNE
ncbi:MAG: hypothetical protein QN189_07815 [Armatimonadota bacterium]|nr:hypothetical protein [Armatimonadota bacterium]MDR7435021.1 hypothetical protein [Armatimonadota bacterium]